MTDWFLSKLKCPVSGESLQRRGDVLVSEKGAHRYPLSGSGIPLLGSTYSPEGERQAQHYDHVAPEYLANLTYPHTIEYTRYLDTLLRGIVGENALGEVAEVCCGGGEALRLFSGKISRAVGIDVSIRMLEEAREQIPDERIAFIQADATNLPIKDDQFDAVFMLGGIHHIKNRERLFAEVYRVLRPSGKFFWREPVSDFFFWKWLRYVIYRLSPSLDHATEQVLEYKDIAARLEKAGLELRLWYPCGGIGFCLFMNSDILIFNRLFRFIPGIRALVRLFARLDHALLQYTFFKPLGLQVIGMAEKIRPITD